MAAGPCDGGCGDTFRFMISDTTDGVTKALCVECSAAWGLALALTAMPAEVFADALDQYARANGLEPAQAPQEPAAEPARPPRRRRPGRPREVVAAAEDATREALEAQRAQAPEHIAEGVAD